MNYELYDPALQAHLFFGYLSIFAAFGAMLALKGRTFHRYCGRVFVVAMIGIFITTVPMSIIKHMYLPFLSSLIALYLTFYGFNYARTRDGSLGSFEGAIAILMLGIGIATVGYAIYLYNFSNVHLTKAQALTFSLGGLVAMALCISDLKAYYQRRQVTGKARIIKHLTAMICAATISVTGFTVPNLVTNPPFLAWLAPSIMALLIVLWWREEINKPSKISRYIKTLSKM